MVSLENCKDIVKR